MYLIGRQQEANKIYPVHKQQPSSLLGPVLELNRMTWDPGQTSFFHIPSICTVAPSTNKTLPALSLWQTPGLLPAMSSPLFTRFQVLSSLFWTLVALSKPQVNSGRSQGLSIIISQHPAQGPARRRSQESAAQQREQEGQTNF